MFAANAYAIRSATVDDEPALRRLAYLDSQRPLSGPALLGKIDGTVAAAISLDDGRVIADPFQPTATLRQLLQLRSHALQAYSHTPSLPERMRHALAAFRTRTAVA